MRPIRTIMMAMFTAGLLICVSYLAIMPKAQPRPGSYRAAVVIVLRSARIDYRDVDVRDGCAPTIQLCRTYAGEVFVQTSRSINGQIACHERWTSCTLTLRDAGIVHAPLPDVLDPLIWRWEQLQGQVMLWVRGMGR